MNVDRMNSPVGGSENAGGSKQGPISSNMASPGQQEALVDSLAQFNTITAESTSLELNESNLINNLKGINSLLKTLTTAVKSTTAKTFKDKLSESTIPFKTETGETRHLRLNGEGQLEVSDDGSDELTEIDVEGDFKASLLALGDPESVTGQKSARDVLMKINKCFPDSVYDTLDHYVSDAASVGSEVRLAYDLETHG